MLDDDPKCKFPSGKWDNDIANYQSEPSIKKYLALRNHYPDRDPSFVKYSGIDQLYALKPLLEKFSLDFADVAASMDADPKAIDRVSLRLLTLLDERRDLEAEGRDTLRRRGIAITNGLINYLIAIILESMEHYDEPIACSSLFLLIREQIGGQDMFLYQSYKKLDRRGSVVAIMVSARNLGWECSLGEVAKILGLNKSSLSRMFSKGELEQLISAEMSRPTIDWSLPDEDPAMRALPRKVREQHP